jgi:hypothetical protein
MPRKRTRGTAIRLIRAVLHRPGPGAALEPDPAGARRLPDWFERNRVQGHTRLRLGPRWAGSPEFEQAAAGFRVLGAGAFTRHVKTREEDPWWPTALPLGPDGRPLSDRDRTINGVPIARGRDVAKEIIDEAHGEGLRVVAYCWHMTEDSVSGDDRFAGWVCREHGEQPADPITGPNDQGEHLDITGPYREVVLQRLLELSDAGADGFYFDYVHLPLQGCWGSALEEAWTAQEGRPAPARAPHDPDYQRFLDFKAEQIEATFAYWRDRVKAEHPEVVFLVSTTTVPALVGREMTTRLVRIADSAKNEYEHAVDNNFNKNVFVDNPELDEPPEHVRQALGWTILRDSAAGRPPHIWAAGLPDVDHAQAFAASLLTFGCVANMDVDERAILEQQEPQDGKTPLDGLRAAFELGSRASPHLAHTTPVRWAALHFSERIRNVRGAQYGTAWAEVLAPLVGAYEVLSQDRLPVGTVDDTQLARGELAGYRVLFLPNPGELTAAQQRAVAAFRTRGGAIVPNAAAWRWSDRAQSAAAAAAFRAAVRPYVETAPVVVRGGPRSAYAVAYRGRDRLVVAVTNDFDWVQITAANEPLPEVINPKPPAAEGVQIGWRSGHGFPQPGGFLPFPRLRAFEAIRRRTLAVERVGGMFRVTLPQFQFLAVLVVARARGGPLF